MVKDNKNILSLASVIWQERKAWCDITENPLKYFRDNVNYNNAPDVKHFL